MFAGHTYGAGISKAHTLRDVQDGATVRKKEMNLAPMTAKTIAYNITVSAANAHTLRFFAIIIQRCMSHRR